MATEVVVGVVGVSYEDAVDDGAYYYAINEARRSGRVTCRWVGGPHHGETVTIRCTDPRDPIFVAKPTDFSAMFRAADDLKPAEYVPIVKGTIRPTYDPWTGWVLDWSTVHWSD